MKLSCVLVEHRLGVEVLLPSPASKHKADSRCRCPET